MVSKGDRLGAGLGVWAGNTINLGCDNRYTSVNAIKFIYEEEREDDHELLDSISFPLKTRNRTSSQNTKRLIL